MHADATIMPLSGRRLCGNVFCTLAVFVEKSFTPLHVHMYIYSGTHLILQPNHEDCLTLTTTCTCTITTSSSQYANPPPPIYPVLWSTCRQLFSLSALIFCLFSSLLTILPWTHALHIACTQLQVAALYPIMTSCWLANTEYLPTMNDQLFFVISLSEWEQTSVWL